MWLPAEAWEGMAEVCKEFLIEQLNNSADLDKLRYEFEKYCQYKTNAAFERNGGNVNNEDI
jgi:hypothetical protein